MSSFNRKVERIASKLSLSSKAERLEIAKELSLLAELLVDIITKDDDGSGQIVPSPDNRVQ